MSIENIIFGVFESDTVEITNLHEGFFPMNPTLAFLTLKRNSLGKLRKAGKDVDSALDNDVKRLKSKGAIAKEKIRAATGTTSGKGEGATVYKLTPQQLEVLSKIQEKYGNVIIDDVMTFRKNVLAPYQLIKRMVKNNKTINAKDKFGMTHAQFKAGVESGKKKIEKRAGHFDKEDSDRDKIKELGLSIDALRELETSFKKGEVIKEYLINKVLKNYHLDRSEFEKVSLEDLKQTYNELKKNNSTLKNFIDSDSKELTTTDADAAQDLVKKNLQLRRGIISLERKRREKSRRENIDNDEVIEGINEERTTIQEKETFSFLTRSNKFNIALGKYMLRREIIKELHDDNKNKNNSLAKRMYIFIIREMIESATERRAKMIKDKSQNQTKIEFNDVERRIYKPRSSVGQEYSGDLGDYVQVIKDEDFGNPKYVKRPPKLVAAEKKIEAEIKKFERSLKKQLDKEDYDELKRYRLINNLITVKEMENPEKLFKSPSEIKGDKNETPEIDEEE